MNGSNADRVRRALRGAAVVALSTLGLAACDDETPPPFEVEGAGSISGLLFYDADRDGFYEPVEGDSALAGVPLSLRVRGTSEVIPGTETTTDAQGRFTITGVAVGTHDLVIDAGFLEGVAVICQNPRPVSVRISEVTSISVTGQVSCLIPIEEAEAQPLGTFITVRGIVTVSPDQLRSGPTVSYIQDETGGIAVSNLASGSMLVGDLVQISGTLGAFGNELQINGPTIDERTEGVGELEPELITVADLAAQGPDAEHPLQGTLIRVEGVVLSNSFGSGGLHGQNAPIRQGDDAAQLRIEANVIPPATLNTVFTVGNCYNLTGVAGQFAGAPQIKPRTTADIEEVPCP